MTETKKIYEQLYNVQSEITDPIKDQKGYNYQYAGFDSYLEIIRPLLKKNELFFMQNVKRGELVSSDKGFVFEIVIDTIIGNFRAKFIGDKIWKRQKLLKDHLNNLKALTQMFPDVAIVLTNQVASHGKFTVPVGGDLLSSFLDDRIYLSFHNERRYASRDFTTRFPEKPCYYDITGQGVRDLEFGYRSYR